MELQDTLRDISNDARGWLKAWASDFTDVEASQPVRDSRAPNPNPYFHSLGQGVYEAALHENYHVGEIAALRKVLGKPRIG